MITQTLMIQLRNTKKELDHYVRSYETMLGGFESFSSKVCGVSDPTDLNIDSIKSEIANNLSSIVPTETATMLSRNSGVPPVDQTAQRISQSVSEANTLAYGFDLGDVKRSVNEALNTPPPVSEIPNTVLSGCDAASDYIKGLNRDTRRQLYNLSNNIYELGQYMMPEQVFAMIKRDLIGYLSDIADAISTQVSNVFDFGDSDLVQNIFAVFNITTAAIASLKSTIDSLIEQVQSLGGCLTSLVSASGLGIISLTRILDIPSNMSDMITSLADEYIITINKFNALANSPTAKLANDVQVYVQESLQQVYSNLGDTTKLSGMLQNYYLFPTNPIIVNQAYYNVYIPNASFSYQYVDNIAFDAIMNLDDYQHHIYNGTCNELNFDQCTFYYYNWAVNVGYQITAYLSNIEMYFLFGQLTLMFNYNELAELYTHLNSISDSTVRSAIDAGLSYVDSSNFETELMRLIKPKINRRIVTAFSSVIINGIYNFTDDYKFTVNMFNILDCIISYLLTVTNLTDNSNTDQVAYLWECFVTMIRTATPVVLPGMNIPLDRVFYMSDNIEEALMMVILYNKYLFKNTFGITSDFTYPGV